MTHSAPPKGYTPAWIPTPALVADIELTRPFSPLTLSPNYRAARLLLRLHGCPVGYADLVAAPGAPIDRARILAALDPATTARALRHIADDMIAHGLPREQTSLEAALDMAARVTCLYERRAVGRARAGVTVAICTRDRPDTLAATLDSLMRQTYQNFEILVVDNAPRGDATERLVRERYPHARYVREPRPGLDWARNRAIAEARGEILASIDDDAIADERWVQALVAAFDSPEVMCVTGLVAPAQLDTAAQELFERYGYSKGFDRLEFSLRAPPHGPGFPYKGYLGTGCNSAFRRDVFEQVGLFDPHLDMGTPVPGGGDLDMFARIIRAGYTLVYEPNAVVFHNHIADMPTLVVKLGQYQQAAIAYLTKCILNDRERALSLIAFTGWSYLRKTIRGLGAVALKRDRPLALVLSQAAYAWLGPLALYRSYRQARAAARDLDRMAEAPASRGVGP